MVFQRAGFNICVRDFPCIKLILKHLQDRNLSNIQRKGNLVKELEWMNVKDKCHYFTCILMFKCLHNLAPSYLCDGIYLANEITSYNTRLHPLNVYTQLCHKRSFKWNGAIMWNALPDRCKNAPSIDVFKSYLKLFIFER